MKEEKSIGINISNNTAAPPPSEAIQAVIALAYAAEANADAIAEIALRLEGTPAVDKATISNCNIQMGIRPKKKKRA